MPDDVSARQIIMKRDQNIDLRTVSGSEPDRHKMEADISRGVCGPIYTPTV